MDCGSPAATSERRMHAHARLLRRHGCHSRFLFHYVRRHPLGHAVVLASVLVAVVVQRSPRSTA